MSDAAWELVCRSMEELRALAGAVHLASWDQETYMPPRGATARGEQLAVLQGIHHERLVDPRLGEALARAEAEPGDEERAAALAALRFDRDRAVRVPVALVKELARSQSRGVHAWRAAREASEFSRFAPELAHLVELRREMADALGVPAGGERYDALLEGYEPGMRVARLEPLLRRLAGWLTPLADRAASARVDDRFLRGHFDAAAQWDFGLELLEAMGFDLQAGRQDRSTHPFSAGIDPGDVRLTTRIQEELPLSALFSTLHEGGHGLYEQGLPERWRGSVLGAAASFGLHESQSRLWENQVGRSLPFWRHFLPRLAARFPSLAGVPLEAFHRAANKVERTLIRVDADEVTYNLHIVLRFELEVALLRGQLEVADLPGAWNDRCAALLGVRPGRDAEGCLQDIHWAWGELGYFPTYTLGNLYAASLFAAAGRDLAGLEDRIGAGQLAPLLGWLREKIHRAGRTLPAEELVRRATGAGLTDEDLRRYLEAKVERLCRP